MLSKKKIQALAKERMEELDKNLFLVELRISANNVIQVEVDRLDGNVAIEDCVSISRNIEHNLDRDQQDFELHVSSAGLDKPFRVKEQYHKNKGEQVKVNFKEGGKPKLEGALIDVRDDGITVLETRKERLEGKKKKVLVTEEHKIQYTEIKETKIVISFKK
jgi:ribosome maturation factor RimP